LLGKKKLHEAALRQKKARFIRAIPDTLSSAAPVASFFTGGDNPERIASTQPRVARNELPWVKTNRNHNPARVESVS
jgi:hypothetical protein